MVRPGTRAGFTHLLRDLSNRIVHRGSATTAKRRGKGGETWPNYDSPEFTNTCMSFRTAPKISWDCNSSYGKVKCFCGRTETKKNSHGEPWER